MVLSSGGAVLSIISITIARFQAFQAIDGFQSNFNSGDFIPCLEHFSDLLQFTSGFLSSAVSGMGVAAWRSDIIGAWSHFC
jgi:hypothetical protein